MGWRLAAVGFSGERWRFRRDGFASIESSGESARLCVGPSEALYYSNAEIADGEFDGLPWEPPVAVEARVRLSGLHYGSMGLGFWNHSMVLDVSNPVWLIYLRARGRYPLQGFFAQSGTSFLPLTLWRGLGLWKLLSMVARPLVPIDIRSIRPAVDGLDLTSWHSFRVEHLGSEARFYVDGRLVGVLPARPGRFRVDVWVDNAVFLPGRDPGRVYRHVTQEVRGRVCLEVEGLRVYTGSGG